MILSGKEIAEKLGTEICITPFLESQLNPNSYNLRLHETLMSYADDILDMKKKPNTIEHNIPAEGLVLQPGRLYLGRTVEYVATNHYVPMIEGRSSIGRLGLFVHITAGLGHIGSSGYWTLEIMVVQPLRIYANVEICQIFFHEITGAYNFYENKYKGSREVQPSFLYREFRQDD